MGTNKLICSLLLGGAMIVAGCEKESETPSGAPAATPQASEQAADDTKAKAEDASDAVKSSAEAASDQAKKTAENASDALKKNADAAADAANTSAASADATKQVQQVMTYIKENKLDLAETTLKKLEDNKASLPKAVQDQLASARTMLDSAKKAAAGGTAAPAAPAAPAIPGTK
jgi:hypothetical protein